MSAAREPSLADRQGETFHPAMSSRHATLLLILLTVAGAWLRLSHLGSKSLWLDEGATVALARSSWQHFAWVWWHGEANLQTIYFLFMRAWIHWGDSEAFLRLPSALFGIASIPTIYIVARKFGASTTALAAAALLAFSPTHVYYSQEARSYTLAIFFVLISSYFFVLAVELDRRSDWALWTIFSILAFYSHDFSALVLVAQAASLLFKEGAPWRRLILCGSIIFVAAIPGLTYVFRASPENLNFVWMPRPSLKEFWHLATFFGGGGVKIALALALWIAGLVSMWRSRHSKGDAFWRGALILLWAVLPPLIIALISWRHPMFLQRYMIFSLPATILLAALGVDALPRLRVGLILMAALCALSLPTILKEYNKPREDWRGASHAILVSSAPGDAVVFFPFYTRVMLDYYRDRYPGQVSTLEVFAPPYYDAGKDVRDLMHELESNPHQFQHVWVVISGKDAALSQFDNGTAAREKLRGVFGPPAVTQFADVQVLEFGR